MSCLSHNVVNVSVMFGQRHVIVTRCRFTRSLDLTCVRLGVMKFFIDDLPVRCIVYFSLICYMTTMAGRLSFLMTEYTLVRRIPPTMFVGLTVFQSNMRTCVT